MLVRVSDDGRDARQCRNFFRRTLRIASRNNNFRQWILPLHAPNRRPCILIRGIRDRTGIQNHEVGVFGGCAPQPARFELALERRAVGLRGAASKIFHVEGGHRLS